MQWRTEDMKTVMQMLERRTDAGVQDKKGSY